MRLPDEHWHCELLIVALIGHFKAVQISGFDYKAMKLGAQTQFGPEVFRFELKGQTHSPEMVYSKLF